MTSVREVIFIGLVMLLFFQAGQATEPECLVAAGLAAGEDGQVHTCLVVDAENGWLNVE